MADSINDRKTLLISGASSGIGHAVCKRLASSETQVFTVDIECAPPDVEVANHYQADLSVPAEVEKLTRTIRNDIDISSISSLINVAGIPGTKPAEQVFQVNLLTVRFLSRQLAAHMRPGGTIVNVGSISGNNWGQRIDTYKELLALDDAGARVWWQNEMKAVEVDPYTFSKEAVIVWTMLQAGELRGTGLRCNVVSPGPVETPLLPTFRDQIGDERIDWVLHHSGRAAQPDEIAQAIEWLAVGESSWVNGHHLVVDGGYTSGLLSGWVDTENAPEPRITFVD